ncbi:hypothetical protein [Nocardia sp. alder85J]|uniref:hypothetical protein n=1 Tax=Nocardia sp. alder85J TaxID=2862949 RepID=UPI001CD73200|nr:hypothetical protein [Nocardia sp. alder85J]MCX4099275.1 hypothetical protein [Nocardia sp. alder85J]
MGKQQHLSQDARRKQGTEEAESRRRNRHDHESDRAETRKTTGAAPPPPFLEPMQGKIDREHEATPAADRRLSHSEAADATRLANAELDRESR